MSDAPPADADARPEAKGDAKDADRKRRDRVDQLLARPAAKSSGSIVLGGARLEYDTEVEFVPVVAEGFDGALGEPRGLLGREDDVRRETPAAVVDDAYREADVVGGDRRLEVEVLQDAGSRNHSRDPFSTTRSIFWSGGGRAGKGGFRVSLGAG